MNHKLLIILLDVRFLWQNKLNLDFMGWYSEPNRGLTSVT